MNKKTQKLVQTETICKEDNADFKNPLEIKVYIPAVQKLQEGKIYVNYGLFKAQEDMAINPKESFNMLYKTILKINGTEIELLAKNSNQLFITRYLKEGWNTIVISPDQACRISSTIFINRVFNATSLVS